MSREKAIKDKLDEFDKIVAFLKTDDDTFSAGEDIEKIKSKIIKLLESEPEVIDYTDELDAPLKEIAQEALNYVNQGTPVRMSWEGLTQRLKLISSRILSEPPAGEFTKIARDFINDANRDFQADRVHGDCIQDYVRALRELREACDKIDRLEAEKNDTLDTFGKEIIQRDEQIEQLQAELKETKEDYSRVVDKFDSCRGTLAWACEQLGIDPNNIPGDGDWHKFLIDTIEIELPKLKAEIKAKDEKILKAFQEIENGSKLAGLKILEQALKGDDDNG